MALIKSDARLYDLPLDNIKELRANGHTVYTTPAGVWWIEFPKGMTWDDVTAATELSSLVLRRFIFI